jgi:hypothetical protein
MGLRTPYLTNPTIAILNNGGPSGTARRLGTELTRYGFIVDIIENADLPEKREASTVLPGTEQKAEIAAFFAELLGMESEAISGLGEAQKRDVTIVLGKDYRYTPLQNHLLSED